jgi:type IV pilus assembly protein PilB
MGFRKDIGELLVRERIITIDQLTEAKAKSRASTMSLGMTLIKSGFVEETDYLAFLSKVYKFPAIDLDSFEIEKSVLELVSGDVCRKHLVMPVSQSGNTLVVAFSDPSNIFVKDDLQFITRCKIEIVIASERSIQLAINKNFSKTASLGAMMNEISAEDLISETAQAVDTVNGDADAPVVKFVNATIADAITAGASDIHIEPYESRLRVRFRIDGTLIEKMQPPLSLGPAVVSRIKIMSKMNIAERRRPQDGRLKVRISNRTVDFRVSCMPMLFGEKIVMRVLDKTQLQVDMTQLGFEQADLDVFQAVIEQPQGMLLITGPTGSGKTTTIYSALAKLNSPGVNISTAEDPVEFNLDGINQVQVNTEIDFTFASALRTFLRQDPDVVMVGEIRDYDTAEIAFKAASTGHLVVSTLHTNGAVETVSRLIEMGIKPYLITSTVSLIIAQRLIGRNCIKCSKPISVPDQVLLDIGVKKEEIGDYNLVRGHGCSFCNDTGLKGRMAIFEVLKMSGAIKRAIMSPDFSPVAFKGVAEELGMRSLRQAALLKLKAGLTNIDQVISSSIGEEG